MSLSNHLGSFFLIAGVALLSWNTCLGVWPDPLFSEKWVRYSLVLDEPGHAAVILPLFPS